MKDTSECIKCKHGKLVTTNEAPKHFINCALKKKRYQYGQRMDCIDFDNKK